MRGLKRRQAAALTNFVGYFLLALFYFFFSLLLLSALNDLIGPSTGLLARTTYCIPIPILRGGKLIILLHRCFKLFFLGGWGGLAITLLACAVKVECINPLLKP